MIVRFLTKKYLPEYSNGTREIYNRDIIVDGKIVHTKITDTLGTVSQLSFFTSILLKCQFKRKYLIKEVNVRGNENSKKGKEIKIDLKIN